MNITPDYKAAVELARKECMGQEQKRPAACSFWIKSRSSTSKSSIARWLMALWPTNDPSSATRPKETQE